MLDDNVTFAENSSKRSVPFFFPPPHLSLSLLFHHSLCISLSLSLFYYPLHAYIIYINTYFNRVIYICFIALQ